MCSLCAQLPTPSPLTTPMRDPRNMSCFYGKRLTASPFECPFFHWQVSDKKGAFLGRIMNRFPKVLDYFSSCSTPFPKENFQLGIVLLILFLISIFYDYLEKIRGSNEKSTRTMYPYEHLSRVLYQKNYIVCISVKTKLQ